VGNFPDLPQQGWVPWLRQQTRKGLQVSMRGRGESPGCTSSSCSLHQHTICQNNGSTSGTSTSSTELAE